MYEMTYENWDLARRADYPNAKHDHWDTWQDCEPQNPASWDPHTGRHWMIDNPEATIDGPF